MLQMDGQALEIVAPEGAALAALLPFGCEHEVIDDQLRLAGEQLRQSLAAVRAIERIGLVHPLPRERAAFGAELVAEPGELLFLGEEGAAGFDPLVS
jgi:hypothetical protein